MSRRCSLHIVFELFKLVYFNWDSICADCQPQSQLFVFVCSTFVSLLFTRQSATAESLQTGERAELAGELLFD
jgi:hypothetical protein